MRQRLLAVGRGGNALGRKGASEGYKGRGRSVGIGTGGGGLGNGLGQKDNGIKTNQIRGRGTFGETLVGEFDGPNRLDDF